jgi:hypothetical protein
MQIGKQQLGFAVALRPIEIIRSRDFAARAERHIHIRESLKPGRQR